MYFIYLRWISNCWHVRAVLARFHALHKYAHHKFTDYLPFSGIKLSNMLLIPPYARCCRVKNTFAPAFQPFVYNHFMTIIKLFLWMFRGCCVVFIFFILPVSWQMWNTDEKPQNQIQTLQINFRSFFFISEFN